MNMIDEIKEKLKEYEKEYYENNKEKINEYSKKYYENNKEKINEYSKKYYENNKKEIHEKTKIKIECEFCKSIVSKKHIARHQKTKKCSKIYNK